MANLKEKQTSPLYEGVDGDNKISEEYRDNKHSISPIKDCKLKNQHQSTYKETFSANPSN